MFEAKVSVVLDGATYVGAFAVSEMHLTPATLVTVVYRGRRTTAPLGGASPESMAKILLKELVRADLTGQPTRE